MYRKVVALGCVPMIADVVLNRQREYHMCMIISLLGVRKPQFISLLPNASMVFKQQQIVHRHNLAQEKQRAKRLGCFPGTYLNMHYKLQS